jgi:hypothetical protein
MKHFENLSFSGPGLKVPVVTFGPRIGPREKLSWFIGICKDELALI